MKCKLYRDLLSLYVGGDLERDEEIAVRAHVGMCAECAREVEEYRAAVGSLRDARPAEPGPSLWAGVAVAIAPEAPERRPAAEPKRGGNEVAFAWLACAAALLMGLGVGLVVQKVLDRETPKPAAPTAGAVEKQAPAIKPAEVAANPTMPDKTDVGTNSGLINDFLSFMMGDGGPRKRNPGKDLMNPDGSFHLQQVEPLPASRRVRF